MRFVIAHMSHETNTFSPVPTPWERFADELGVGPNVTRIIDGEVLLCDASGNLVRACERPIVLLGVQGLAVIDAGDAVLVSSLERSPEVRKVVSQLRRRGRSDLI